MTKELVLLCGVPGSGKTWVIDHIKPKYVHLDHDAIAKFTKSAVMARTLTEHALKLVNSPKHIILDCPFSERVIREHLLAEDFKVTPVFIVEHPDTIVARYYHREGRPATPATLTRARTIADRANEWKAMMGTSNEVLEYLKSL